MKRLLQRTAALGVLVLLAAGAPLTAGDKKEPPEKKAAPTPNYYPLTQGNEWHMQVTVGANTVKVVQRVTKIESIDGVALARIEAGVDGKVSATEHLRQTAQGVFRHRYNGAECVPPLPVLKYPIKPGDKWEGEVKIGTETAKYRFETSEATIEVLAGKFKTVRIDGQIDTNGKVLNLTNWLAPDVGIVKQVVESGPLNIVLELEKYDIKKERRRRP